MSAENSGKQQKAKPRGKPFVKGQSGNPGGRPKGYDSFREGFREEKDLSVIKKRLMDIFSEESAKDSDVIMAARLWYEYGFGKAPAAPDDNEALRASGLPRELTAAQVLAIARGETP